MPANIINYARYALYLILIVITMVLYQAWDTEHPHAKPETTVATPATASNDYVPAVTTAAATTSATTAATTPAAAEGQLIHITTDVLDVSIDTKGGNVTEVRLLKYPQELHSTTPFLLLNDNASTRYLAQSGLLSTAGPDTSQGQGTYTAEQTSYTLADGENSLIVKLNWKSPEGVTVTKLFTFKRNDYAIGVDYQLDNQSNAGWKGNLYLQLMRTNTPPPSTKGFVSLTTFFGAAVNSPDKPFNKISFTQMQQNPFNQTIVGGWEAMIQHYFVSAWVPDKTSTSQYFSKVTNDGLYTIGMIGPELAVGAHSVATTHAELYVGPSIADRLQKVATGLPLTIDYGWFWFISAIIFWMMEKIYNVVGNWGWSIVLVTLVIKLLFYRLSAKSYRSMSVMKKLQPRINQMKERYGDDKQKFTQAMLEIYKKEKVNPMSGCLPLLIQIPVFIALYWVLIESVQLRQAPFILWIHDLTQKDPYYVLPVLMGLSMFLQQRLSPPPPDPMQAKIMMFMPVVFTAMFINFPAGLMLYWFVNNSLSFLQQWYIMRTINAKDGKHKPKKLVRERA